MINNIFKKKVFKDKRGLIADVIYNNQINHIAYITTNKNGIRGNHYHKKTTQYTFVLDGRIKYYHKNKSAKKVSQLTQKLLVKTSITTGKKSTMHKNNQNKRFKLKKQ